MADEDITLDGKPLHSLRVADLKAALEQRKLPKSGPKNALIKRLKGALMLEDLQRSSASNSGLQPNSQIGEEMSQNSFIKQYLATQQELLRQKLEREAQHAAETDESSAAEEKEEPSEGNDPLDTLRHSVAPQPVMARPEPEGHRGLRMGLQEAPGAPGTWPLWNARHQPEPSPPRAVASLSVRVLGQPDRQGPQPAVPQRASDKEGAAPAEPGSAHPVLHLSRSAMAAAAGPGRDRDDSDDGDDDDDSDEESDEEEEWGAQVKSGRAPAQLRPQQQPQQQAHASAPPAASRSRRKLQPPQHIPPPQAHPPPMQLRHPTPPPSPPPELSFPLPDTPKQSPPNAEEAGGSGGESPRARAPGGRRRPPPPQRDEEDDSDSSARSSSPEPTQRRGAGLLAQLAHRMDAEKGQPAAGEPEAVDMSVGTVWRCSASSSSSSAAAAVAGPPAALIPGRPTEGQRRKEGTGDGAGNTRPGEKETPQKREEPEKMEVESTSREEEEEQQKMAQRRPGEERDRKGVAEGERHLPPWKRGRAAAAAATTLSTGRGEEAELKTDSAHSEAALAKAPVVTPSVTVKRPHVSTDSAAPPIRAPPIRAPPRGGVVITVRDSGSSSDSDSGSDSPSPSSQSSTSSQEKPPPAKLVKSAGHGREGAEEKQKTSVDGEKATPRQKAEREVSESSEAPAKEAEPDTQSAMAQEPASEAKPANGSGLEESTTPKAFAARKISLNSSKTSPPTGADAAAAGGTAVESETGGGATAAGRKRRWGSSAAVTTKKPSISITTDSLRSLIPDIKMTQEAVVDLHPEELHLSGEEEEESQGMDNGRADHDLGLKIRRTVTQVVPGDGKENGQGREPQPPQDGDDEDEEEEEEEHDEAEQQQRLEKEKQRKAPKERRRSSTRAEDAGAPRHSPARQEAEAQKVTPSDSVVRRSISQQKSGMSVTIDDAGAALAPRQPSPPRGKLSAIVHVSNLVRPFTLGQLKELLKRTGTVLEEGFWIDKIKSHCFVTYATTDEAQATRAALHGLKWPPSNPKVLSVDFSQQDELDFHRGTLKVERLPEKPGPPPGGPPARLPPLMPERERDRDKGRERGGGLREQWAEHGPMGVAMRDPWAERGGPLGGGGGGGGVRDQWAEREREMQRREQARCEREWDRDKIREFGQPGEEVRRSRSRDRERRRRERAKSKERKSDKKDEPPAKLLDDLFLKTKAAPCIYWLPLTEEQVKKRKEQEQEDTKRKEEERKERLKAREAGGPLGGVSPSKPEQSAALQRRRERSGLLPAPLGPGGFGLC
ncbi:apoptotic chromatin condensation inducer 1b [Gadus chalcogrammus]|uniref:apoptotic chromatin condensation inducer 1b n=1 Tax=Gadus chalcogrammus TaxID=1042646 RepID=UPI0024C4B3BA|nr:apoptotic chromatin condensation inducer 1b [Gadus chalcogrammus]